MLFGWADGNDEVSALRVTGVANPVMIAGGNDADVASFHTVGDAVDIQFANTFLDQPDFVVQMRSIGFVDGADLLRRFVNFNLDIAGLQHAVGEGSSHAICVWILRRSSFVDSGREQRLFGFRGIGLLGEGFGQESGGS
jgi:hypothetical protein